MNKPHQIIEGPDKVTDTMENLNFCNISAQGLYRMPLAELLELRKLAAKIWGWDINTFLGRICINRYLISSVKNN